MTRSAILIALLLACLTISPAPSSGQISAKLVMEDQRAGEHILWLKWKWSADGRTLDAHLVLSEKEILVPEAWDVCFENEQVLANTVAICRAAKEDKRVQIKGREIRTLRGRAWLVESIRSL